MARGPLSDIRILDLSHVWAGPLCTRILSDLGADVIKIERSYARGLREPVGDPIGGWIGKDPGKDPWNRNAAFVKLARNSRSVCLDLKHKKGREIFLELVGYADVVIENFSASTMSKLNLDYETLVEANPNIIYLTMPGFGKTGPYKDWVAFGPIIEPMSGLTAAMGYSLEEPRNSGVALVDPTSATSAAAAIVTAIRSRKKKVGGSIKIEMSLHEAGVSFNGPWLIDSQLGAPSPVLNNGHPNMCPHGVYPCKGEDEWLALACEDQEDWETLAKIDDSLDPSWTIKERQECADSINLSIAVWCETRTKESAAEELQNMGIAAGPVNTVPDMFKDPQVQERKFFVPFERAETPMPGNPIKMEGIDSSDWTRCPDLGEHNFELLEDWLGYTPDELNQFLEEGVIADRPPS